MRTILRTIPRDPRLSAAVQATRVAAHGCGADGGVVASGSAAARSRSARFLALQRASVARTRSRLPGEHPVTLGRTVA